LEANEVELAVDRKAGSECVWRRVEWLAQAVRAEDPEHPGRTSHSAKAAPARPAGRPAKSADGLSEEVLTQIAQQKYEAQEDRLRDVVRQSMALLRDYKKLATPDCERRVVEIRKALLKYEMQHIRTLESQERRRKLEIQAFEGEAERCRQEAELEGAKIVELREVLERERKRRKRYEQYEELAAEVNRKKSRADSLRSRRQRLRSSA